MSGRFRELLIEAFMAGVEAARAHSHLAQYLPETPAAGRTIVLGAGKAAAEMAAVADATLHGDVTGLVITRDGHLGRVAPRRIRVVEASHPVPDDRAFDLTAEIMRIATSATRDDRVIFLASGGGSSLLACPSDGLSRQEKTSIHRSLVRSGAPIADINLVRTHLSKVKGGRLAELIQPASVSTYVISDVVGDHPALVASGPTIPVRYEPERARQILLDYGVGMSPGVDAALDNSRPVFVGEQPVEVVANAKTALAAVDSFLRARGWATISLGDALIGHASEVGAAHAEVIRQYGGQPGVAFISGGELTVRVTNPAGRGGPNLEYLTALLLGLKGLAGIEAIAGDSDGIDGSEDNAGGYIDPAMYSVALRIDAERLLATNESYSLFQALGGLVVTGPTRTNVNDIRIVLVGEPNSAGESLEVNIADADNSWEHQARIVLLANDRGGYTVPAEDMYPHQWNWDSAFVALGFATFDPARAVRELESLMQAQWSEGMVPQIAFRSPDGRYFPGPEIWRTGRAPSSSGITQPPVAASIAWTLWQQTTDPGLRLRLRALFPRLLAWHRWFRTERDPEGQGVAVIVHPWESGRDNSPEWDAPGAAIDVSEVKPYERRDLDHADASNRPQKQDYDRYMALVEYGRDVGWDQRKMASEGPFRVADVGISMMLLRADQDLAAWAEALDERDARAEIEQWLVRARSGIKVLWDPQAGAFCSRDMITGLSSGLVTSASFLAFYARAAEQAQTASLISHWDRISTVVELMIPSFDPERPRFDARRYWRGPCWAVVNYMVAHGLSEAGFRDRALRVHRDTHTMIRRSGFREAFSPVDGEGTGGHKFSWTAAMWLAWAGKQGD